MDKYQGIKRKITSALFLTQSVVSAAVITTGTVNSIAGADLSGMVAWAGLPMAVLLLSGALGSLTWGFLMERIGRRKGLVIGLMLGAGGGVLAGSALWLETFSLFLAGMTLFYFAVYLLFLNDQVSRLILSFIPKKRSESGGWVRDRHEQIKNLVAAGEAYQNSYFKLIRTCAPIVLKQLVRVIT